MLTSLIQNKKIRLMVCLSAFTCLTFGGASLAQRYTDDSATQNPASFESSISTALKIGHSAESTPFAAPAAMNAFYDARGEKPYWVGSFGVRKAAKELTRKFETSWTHALNPERYHLSEIKALMESRTPAQQARLELLLTDGYIRYVQDLTGMRVNAASQGLEAEHWEQGMPATQALSWLNSRGRIEQKLESIEPKGAVYNKFRQELVKLWQQEPEIYEAALPIEASGLIKPGQAHKAIPTIRLRMGQTDPAQGANVYDDTLAAAVMVFQKEHNIKPDGVIGAETIQFMNRTREDKIRQLMVNMERMRWMPDNLGQTYIVVNIPSATLWAVDNGAVEFEMPVIVGRAERPTPAFRAEIMGMRLNPDWTIPPTIKRKDILPKIQQDVGFLAGRNISLSKVQDGRRVNIDPMSIDWANISSRELHQIDMVQVPSDDNPLGQYRVLMPNKHNIYLHDTNQPELFDKPSRALSSGCMRMKDPAKVAAFILKAEEGWDQERITRTVASDRRLDVPVSRTMPVYAVYYTAWLTPDGEISYAADPYGADRKLYESLSAMGGLPGTDQSFAHEIAQNDQSTLATR